MLEGKKPPFPIFTQYQHSPRFTVNNFSQNLSRNRNVISLSYQSLIHFIFHVKGSLKFQTKHPQGDPMLQRHIVLY